MHWQVFLLISVLVIMFIIMGAMALWALWILYLALCGDYVKRAIERREYQKRLKGED